MMVLEDIKKRLCPDIVHDVRRIGDRSLVSTRFTHADGESIGAYIVRKGAESYFSDLGRLTVRLETLGIDHRTPTRTDYFQTQSRRAGADFDGRMFFVPIEGDNPGSALVRFCELMVRLSALEAEHTRHRKSQLPVRLVDFVERRFSDQFHVETDWHHPKHDPDAMFPVDIHVNGETPPVGVFHVLTPQKGAAVTASSLFFEARKYKLRSLAVLSGDAQLGRRDLGRLRTSVDSVVYGVDEEQIADFIAS